MFHTWAHVGLLHWRLASAYRICLVQKRVHKQRQGLQLVATTMSRCCAPVSALPPPNTEEEMPGRPYRFIAWLVLWLLGDMKRRRR